MPVRQDGHWNHLNSPKRALVLACGNPLRGDDAVALNVAESLMRGICDGETEIHIEHQWLPEMAEMISESNVVIFVDASREIPAGAVCTRLLAPADSSKEALTHSVSPERLLALARDLYHSLPQEAYLVSVGGKSFELSSRLSEPVRRAIPLALNHLKAILSGVSVPPPHAIAI